MMYLVLCSHDSWPGNNKNQQSVQNLQCAAVLCIRIQTLASTLGKTHFKETKNNSREFVLDAIYVRSLQHVCHTLYM